MMNKCFLYGLNICSLCLLLCVKAYCFVIRGDNTFDVNGIQIAGVQSLNSTNAIHDNNNNLNVRAIDVIRDANSLIIQNCAYDNTDYCYISLDSNGPHSWHPTNMANVSFQNTQHIRVNIFTPYVNFNFLGLPQFPNYFNQGTCHIYANYVQVYNQNQVIRYAVTCQSNTNGRLT